MSRTGTRCTDKVLLRAATFYSAERISAWVFSLPCFDCGVHIVGFVQFKPPEHLAQNLLVPEQITFVIPKGLILPGGHMSTISSTNNAYLYNQMFGGADAVSPFSNSGNSASATSARRSLTNSYGAPNNNSVQSMLLGQTLGSMGIGAGDSLSFAELLGLRDDMKSEFEAKVNSDLRKLGVGLDKKAYQDVRGAAFKADVTAELEKAGIEGDYSFEADGKGGIKVVCSDEETRVAVEEWLAKNPDKVKEFNSIQNPSRKDMLEFRDQSEKDFEKMLRDYIKKEGLNSDATINLKTKGGVVSVTSNDPKVKAALEKLFKDKPELGKQYEGIESLTKSDDVKFQLTFDKKGKPVVVSNHPDKDLIQSYFDTNPDSVKKFQQLDSITNVDQARKAQKVDVSEIRKRIQLESMSTWFASTGGSTSSIMDFTGGNSALMNGLNKKV